MSALKQRANENHMQRGDPVFDITSPVSLLKSKLLKSMLDFQSRTDI